MRCKWISLLVSVVLVASVAMLVAPKAAAQNTGDYRSKQTGNWGEAATWERYEGTAWVDATTAPTYTDGVITIRNGHTVTIVADVTVDQVVIEAGGQVTVNSGFTFSTNNGTGDELTIYGTFLHSGTVASTMNGTGVLASGGTYIHNTISSAKRMVDFFNAGSVAADSTFIYRGSLTLRPAMSMSGQTYGNLTFESTSGSWSTEALVGGTATTIKGNFTLGSGVTFNNNTLVGLNVAGNWTNNGTFTAGSGTVTFNGGTTQNLTLNTATTFNNLTVGSGTILVETVSTDNATVSALTNNGTIRKAKSVSGDSNTFGLAGGPINGANLNINVTAGSFTSIQVDRTDSNHAN
ncbi:MAG: hypothetical protein FJZ88_08405, partial [Chloroflexi bacterium]|nr:hypothetical protein [Chloroflexota bacterium]